MADPVNDESDTEYIGDLELAAATGIRDSFIDKYAKEGLLDYKEDDERNRLYPAMETIQRVQDIYDMAQRGMKISEMRDLFKEEFHE